DPRIEVDERVGRGLRRVDGIAGAEDRHVLVVDVTRTRDLRLGAQQDRAGIPFDAAAGEIDRRTRFALAGCETVHVNRLPDGGAEVAEAVGDIARGDVRLSALTGLNIIEDLRLQIGRKRIKGHRLDRLIGDL